MIKNNKYRLDLNGEWEFALGQYKEFDDIIVLPSSTEVSEKGEIEINEQETMFLSRKRPFTGVSRYRRQITIKNAWGGKYIYLYLERTKYTKVIVDGEVVSESHETLVPQKHQLSQWLTVGEHELVIEVDNDLIKYDDFSESLYNGHQYTDHTQTNWNGIIGDIYLEAVDPIYLEYVSIEKPKDIKGFKVEIAIDNQEENQDAQLTLTYRKKGYEKEAKSVQESVQLQNGPNILHLNVIEKELTLWNEFERNLYEVQILIQGNVSEIKYDTLVGFRDIVVDGQRILLNGESISLRGNLDCCIYPLTGYAPMEVNEWIRIYKQAKEYGINHYRFHSWCPPEAAFVAADIEGIYLQVELSCFANGFYEEENPLCDHSLNRYLYDQSMKVIKEYGNHPSFLIFAIGNEMIGDISAYEKLLKKLKALRPDKLYTQGANNFLEDPICSSEDDIWITMRTTKIDNVRASFSHGDKPLGHLQQKEQYATIHDYEEGLKISEIPVIAHEIGQYQSYPNFNEIDKYIGVTKSTALKVFQKKLKEKNHECWSEEFYYNSGALLIQCYKEEIEALLRTNQMGGFQLLGLQDFPGQGTALVGIWDNFLDSKGFITPTEWREFCGPQVILCKMEKGIYTSGEAIEGEIWIYNFGEEDIINQEITVTLYSHAVNMKEEKNAISSHVEEYPNETFYSQMDRKAEDDILATTTLFSVFAPKGQLTYVNKIYITTEETLQPKAVYMEIECNHLKNHYPLWIYPILELPLEKKPFIFNVFSKEAEEALKQGKTVGVFSSQWDNTIEGFFPNDFWCYPMFKKACEDKGIEIAPGTLGLACKKDHPALAQFPTESFSSWQWRQIVNESRPMILDGEGSDCEPIVQVIDNFDRNHKLSILFEKKVYNGKLVICTVDLLEYLDIPEVKQLYYSLLMYIEKEQ